ARLDVEGVAWLGKRLREEMNHGLAIVMASHEPALVETLGARTVELGGPRG
ncbi:MAG TPA: ABC transporter ATP-binding protein, partial [Cutibacterium acnes]|nr:ABC transporter ATP-binding protein [Cutibacterium acnes]